MGVNRRTFLKVAGMSGALAAVPRLGAGVRSGEDPEPAEGIAAVGCLVDTTLCIGCRKCEEACNLRHQLGRPEVSFADRTVFRRERRPSESAFTVVNEYSGPPSTRASASRPGG